MATVSTDSSEPMRRVMEIPGFGPTEAKEKTDPFSRWEREVANRRGRHKAIIAIANKMVRTGWVVLAKDLHYDPQLL